MSTDKYDAGIAKYIIVTCVSGNVEHIDTKEQAAHIFQKDIENFHFQIILTDNYYTNPNSMHVSFPIKIKKRSHEDDDIITVNNFFPSL